MPIFKGHDNFGYYYKYGKSGKKYYYTTYDRDTRDKAYNKAKRQGIAIRMSKMRKSKSN